jgi:hypothetical protein
VDLLCLRRSNSLEESAAISLAAAWVGAERSEAQYQPPALGFIPFSPTYEPCAACESPIT